MVDTTDHSHTSAEKSGLAMHVAAGMDWHGHRVPEGQKWAGPVIYIAGEGGTGLHNRVEAMRRERPDLMERIENSAEFLLLTLATDFCTSNDAEHLVQTIKDAMETMPALIVVETLARTMGNGDENTAKDIGQFVRSMDLLRAETGAHVMVIHHSGKDASKGARGSGSLRAAADTELELTRSNGVVLAEARKQRDMPCDGVFAYQLRSVFLGFDDDGDRVTSAVVTPCGAVRRKSKVRLTGTDKIGMQALSDALAQHGEVKPGDMFPSNHRTVTLERWRECCDRHSFSSGESDSAARVAFHKLKHRLQDKELVRIVDGFVWPIARDLPEPLPPLSTFTSNAGNVGHAAVTTVTAPCKGGNAVTLTRPGQEASGPSPAMSLRDLPLNFHPVAIRALAVSVTP